MGLDAAKKQVVCFLTSGVFWQAASSITLITGVIIANNSLAATKKNAQHAAKTAREIASKKAAIDWLFASHSNTQLSKNIKFIITMNSEYPSYITHIATVSQENIKSIKAGSHHNDETDDEVFKAIIQDSQQVIFVLNYYEHLAVAIHEGIFDEGTIQRASKTSIIKLWHACKGFVVERRGIRQSASLYIQLEALVKKWQ